mgnify:CR=1 FL=1
MVFYVNHFITVRINLNHFKINIYIKTSHYICHLKKYNDKILMYYVSIYFYNLHSLNGYKSPKKISAIKNSLKFQLMNR